MLYPVYVHTGDAKRAHGVTFPDFAGCFAAADDWADLPAAIQEAVQAHFHGEGAQAVPQPTPLEVLASDPQFEGGAWMLVDIDAFARSHGSTRSGFLAQAARQAMAQQDA